ncbi:MAG: permease, partial [Halobacteriovoraceae bacterium]|nr:permease [Halobacteriovoraceae bacterium]
RFLVLLAGIPIYICASAATPIAAALVLKGMSPGVALLFLMAGPATNISNLVILQKYINKKGVLLNILGITVTALLASFIVDFCYEYFSWPASFKIMDQHHHHSFSWWENICGAILAILILKGVFLDIKKKMTKKI